MRIYRLECLTEDGDIEVNGYYFNRDNAEIAKGLLDKQPMNTKYSIKQNIVEIETDDELRE